MSAEQVNSYNKADISFLYGYKKHRKTYRRIVLAHVFEILLFVIFIPIDSTILTAGDRIIIAQAIAVAVACISLLITIYQYQVSFLKYGVAGYSQFARDLSHITQQPVVSAESIQSSTSQIVLHAASGITVQGLDQKAIDVYANVARQEIQDEMGRRFPQLNSWSSLQQLFSSSSMLIVIILMAKSDQMNSAQIAVLSVYLVIEAFLKIKFLILLILVILSPLFCIGIIIYACCCVSRENQGGGTLDVKVTEANLDHVVKCGGECAICMQDLKLNETIYQLPCSDKHIFHTGCLDKWMHVKGNCPICRANLPMVGAAVHENPPAAYGV